MSDAIPHQNRALNIILWVFQAGLALLLQPTLSFVWDVLFFARPMSATELLGAGIALLAIYVGSRPASQQAQRVR